MFRTDKNIPLDKIQDLAVIEGPMLRWAGLANIWVETAGGAVLQGQPNAGLVGIVDTLAFRDAVLAQRDRLLGFGGSSDSCAAASAATPVVGGEDILIEIRDSLRRIEGLLEKRPLS